MKIHTVEQGSEAWHELRNGRLTASNAAAIATNGKGLSTLVLETMAKKYAKTQEESYTNKDMERGQELEDQARSIYELENDVTIEQVGFVELNEYAGCSPDGFIGEDRLIEIKCHNNTKHFNLILNGDKAIESKYIWQIQMQLLITERTKGILLAYNPNFEQSLLTFEIMPDEKKFEKLRSGLENGTELIKQITEDINV